MSTNYYRIEKAIQFLVENFKQQPSLEEVAYHVHVSPHHFQRIFSEWAGISPKKFVQYISIEHAKIMLQESRSLSEVSDETGLSGTGRLHDLFVTVEAMTPGEYKNGGVNLNISYSTSSTPYGDVFIASTKKGVCMITFIEKNSENNELIRLKEVFPNAEFVEKKESVHKDVASCLSGVDGFGPLKLHVKGTPFQIKVWRALLQIPFGTVTTYSALADRIENPKASRAVGSAVGKNPIAYIIPCHRVITSSGIIGNYRWGSSRKKALIGREAALKNDH